MRQKTIFFVAMFCVFGWCCVSCESRNEPSPENEGSATFVGKPFSIAADKQVVFSPGNLQYIQSTKTWAFASQQYAFLGTANVVGGKEVSDGDVYGRGKSGEALADTIDLFGWSANKGSSTWGVDISTEENDYRGAFVDWGKNIGDGKTWRTLSAEEWTYLLVSRADASSKYGVARILINETEYANGLVLLPDSCPDNIGFKSGMNTKQTEAGRPESFVKAYADYQTFTLAQWTQLESAGAVFLPAAGGRDGAYVGYIQRSGCYWSNNEGNGSAYYLFFDKKQLLPQYFSLRYYGHSVRLVKDL